MRAAAVEHCRDDDALQVQQEYHDLFETPAGDPEAVMRWRNRALRFVLAPELDGLNAPLPDFGDLDASAGKAAAQETAMPKLKLP